jgi:hypothetical protein
LPVPSARSSAASLAKSDNSRRPPGESNTPNPPVTASIVDAIFFPQRESLRLDERQYSPDLQLKLVETALRTSAFQQAEEVAHIWGGPPISARHLGRVVEAVGEELVEKRDAEVDDFTHHRRGPEGPDPQHELAAVFVDGGRVQVRDATPGQGNGVHDPRWREDKVARMQTMTTVCHSADPCPEPPACFLDPKKLKGLVDAAPDDEIAVKEGEFAAAPPPAANAPPTERWQPEPLVRTCVATMRSIDHFRWMVQAEAKRRHFSTAARRAFVADGLAYNWTLHAKHFSDFVPILDFLHVASYLHAAAKALDEPGRAAQWVRDAWQGRITDVMPQLRGVLTAANVGDQTLPDEHALKPVQEAANYLTHHADKMDYPRYRRDGLPTTSSLIESQIKEFHRRLKGTEKFWNPSNAEAMLQLLAWSLRDDGPTLKTT